MSGAEERREERQVEAELKFFNELVTTPDYYAKYYAQHQGKTPYQLVDEQTAELKAEIAKRGGFPVEGVVKEHRLP